MDGFTYWCKSCLSVAAKNRYQRNLERQGKTRKQYHAKSADEIKEETKKRGKRYRFLARERINVRNLLRRKLVKENGGTFSYEEWKDLCNHYGNRCLACGRNDVLLSVDHIVPVSFGGESDIHNLQPLCLSCNARKNATTVNYRIFWDAAVRIQM